MALLKDGEDALVRAALREDLEFLAWNYVVRRSALHSSLASVLVSPAVDSETVQFLLAQVHSSWLGRRASSWAVSLLTPFMSLTDANGLLDRGHMLVLTGHCVRRLMAMAAVTAAAPHRPPAAELSPLVAATAAPVGDSGSASAASASSAASAAGAADAPDATDAPDAAGAASAAGVVAAASAAGEVAVVLAEQPASTTSAAVTMAAAAADPASAPFGPAAPPRAADQDGLQARSHVSSTLHTLKRGRPHLRLLDVGAGDGAATLSLATALGVEPEHVTATEASAPMVRALQGRGFRALHTTSLSEGALAGSGLFDVVSVLNVLDRADDPAGLVADVRRLLAPGGVAIFAVVLPFRALVEDGAEKRRPRRPLRLPRAALLPGVEFEASASMVYATAFEPAGFRPLAFSSVPYLCEGDGVSRLFSLRDAVFVLEPVPRSCSGTPV